MAPHPYTKSNRQPVPKIRQPTLIRRTKWARPSSPARKTNPPKPQRNQTKQPTAQGVSFPCPRPKRDQNIKPRAQSSRTQADPPTQSYPERMTCSTHRRSTQTTEKRSPKPTRQKTKKSQKNETPTQKRPKSNSTNLFLQRAMRTSKNQPARQYQKRGFCKTKPQRPFRKSPQNETPVPGPSHHPHGVHDSRPLGIIRVGRTKQAPRRPVTSSRFIRIFRDGKTCGLRTS